MGLLLLLFFALRQPLTIRHYTIGTAKLTESVRFALFSDLHGTWYGKRQERILCVLQREKPDLLLLPGDMLDEKKPWDAGLSLLSQIPSFGPCFFVTGNHEYKTGHVDKIKKTLQGLGITVLEGSGTKVSIKNQTIWLNGIDDRFINRKENFSHCPQKETPLQHARERAKEKKPFIGGLWQKQIENCQQTKDPEHFCVLLSHRPEQVTEYKKTGFDLIVCGHAHGGQIRIPGLLNGLFAPNQGFFPAFAGGLYKFETATMVVSRGLVKNHLPRVFNPPEICILDIVPQEENI